MDAGNWIALASFALAFLVALLGILWYLTKEIDEERQWREEADREITARMAADKLEAVRTFATAGAIEKSEERLAIAIDRLSARLETVIGRIETLSTELARAAGRKTSA